MIDLSLNGYELTAALAARYIVISALRLGNQMISRAGPRSAAAVVARLGAVQAQEFGPATWGLGLRMPPGATAAAIAREVDAGRILRVRRLDEECARSD